jgi:hypothetical protein
MPVISSPTNVKHYPKIKALEKALFSLGEGFAIDDEIRRELNELKTWLSDHAIDPYELPNSDRQ